MFSALKKLTKGGDERGSGAPTPMSSSLQKKFSRGVHYNMKILIKGDRNVGKSCLLQRLQGGPFIEEYVPTEQIQAAAIHWTYKDTDHIVKVDVWEVVDKARSKRKPPLGLKLDNTGTAGGGGQEDTPALDATFLDVYKDASGVILMMDITKPWTIDYVVKELDKVPADLPLVLLGNHCDMQHHRQLHVHHIEQALHHARQTRTAPVRYAESSMRNGFGLRFLHKFLSVPFLRLQRTSLLQQLQRNQRDAQDLESELNDFQTSEESDYVTFVERLASKRRAGAGEVPRGDRSPSIVLGAGKPIIPPNVNPLMSSNLTPSVVRVPPEPPQQIQYVSAELLAPSQQVSFDTTPSKMSHSSSTTNTPTAAGGGASGGGELDEFYAGALDSSFLDDTVAPAQYTQPAYDSDSDNDNTINPMVASTQDDLDESDYRSSTAPFAGTNTRRDKQNLHLIPPISSTKKIEQNDSALASRSDCGNAADCTRLKEQVKADIRRDSVEIEQLMTTVSVTCGLEGGQGDASTRFDDQFELWAGAARRSPEGGEDPDVSAEPPSSKEEKKHKKSKKSKDKDVDGDRSERKEKKHKHKKSKSEKKQQGLLLTPDQERTGQDQYDSL